MQSSNNGCARCTIFFFIFKAIQKYNMESNTLHTNLFVVQMNSLYFRVPDLVGKVTEEGKYRGEINS